MTLSKYDPEYGPKIFKFMKSGKSITAAAVHFDVHRDTLYEWAKVHPEFKHWFERAIQASEVYYEEALQNMTTDTDKKNHNIKSLEFLMANRFRKTYAKPNKQEIEIKEHRQLSPEELDRQLEMLMSKAKDDE